MNPLNTYVKTRSRSGKKDEEESVIPEEVGELIKNVIPQDEVILQDKSVRVRLAFIILKCCIIVGILALIAFVVFLLFVQKGIVDKFIPLLEHFNQEEREELAEENITSIFV